MIFDLLELVISIKVDSIKVNSSHKYSTCFFFQIVSKWSAMYNKVPPAVDSVRVNS